MMAKNQITKDIIKKLIKIPGKTRGVGFHTDTEYVREKKGEKGLIAVKEELINLGCPIDYENIKITGWYPVGLRAVSVLAIKKVFNWSDKEIEDMGNTAPKYSFIVRLLMKYFLTFSMTHKQGSNYWVKHYTVGKLEPSNYDLEKKYYTVRVKDFKIHPILCIYLGGYIVRIGQFLLIGKNFKVKETKCMFKGDPYHEYVVRWE